MGGFQLLINVALDLSQVNFAISTSFIIFTNPSSTVGICKFLCRKQNNLGCPLRMPKWEVGSAVPLQGRPKAVPSHSSWNQQHARCWPWLDQVDDCSFLVISHNRPLITLWQAMNREQVALCIWRAGSFRATGETLLFRFKLGWCVELHPKDWENSAEMGKHRLRFSCD